MHTKQQLMHIKTCIEVIVLQSLQSLFQIAKQQGSNFNEQDDIIVEGTKGGRPSPV